MKFHQEFRVPEPLSKVWLFFEQPLRVAECIPGFEKAVPLEDKSVKMLLCNLNSFEYSLNVMQIYGLLYKPLG